MFYTVGKFNKEMSTNLIKIKNKILITYTIYYLNKCRLNFQYDRCLIVKRDTW